MRITISCILFIGVCLVGQAQRLEFKDPDLTWSFKKPGNWKIFDNGLEVKVSPTTADTSTLYTSITYFESAKPIGLTPESLVVTSSNEGSVANHEVKIGKYKCQVTDKQSSAKSNTSIIRIYRFTEAGQRWEITVVSPTVSFKKYDRLSQKIIRSLLIERN